jgi:hypothetical protein
MKVFESFEKKCIVYVFLTASNDNMDNIYVFEIL